MILPHGPSGALEHCRRAPAEVLSIVAREAKLWGGRSLAALLEPTREEHTASSEGRVFCIVDRAGRAVAREGRLFPAACVFSPRRVPCAVGRRSGVSPVSRPCSGDAVSAAASSTQKAS